MWKKAIFLWLCLSGHCLAGPLGPKRNMPIMQKQEGNMEKESTAAVVVTTENDAIKPEAVSSLAVSDAPNMLMISTLTLPSNATSIRADITDGFSCANRSYGYYADVENDCQIFHVCLPVTYADGKENLFRWSFICPEETIFSQDSFTCMRREDMTIDCEESFQYYELNRNFGATEEEEHKHMIGSTISNSNDINKEALHAPVNDQEPTMTAQVTHEHPIEVAEKPIIPQASKPMQAVVQKEKPMIQNVQKPNRRKPSLPNTSIPNKKKPQIVPLRKITPAATAQPVTTTTMEILTAEKETKPPRFTKRPITLSAHLKEKIQPIKEAEHLAPAPVRTDLYNQKRKRPSIFNKKETTTVKIIEEASAVTTDPTMAIPSDPIQSQSENNSQDPITSLPSETSSITLSPDDKISKPLTTESIVPIEAFEEIPAVITEVEELNTDQNPNKGEAEGTNYIVSFPVVNTEKSESAQPEDSPAIFQQNSEENSTPMIGSLIEEMENEKPNNAPDTIPPSSELENQDPMIDQMLTDTDSDSNKQSMGGFKPVDPAMAAEAEALIANFLNTLMKSEKTNSEPVMPISSNDDSMKTDEMKDSDKTEINQSEMEINTEMKPEIVEDQKPLFEPIKPDPLPTVMTDMMMMNNQPEEEMQIPVQVIQSPNEVIAQPLNSLDSESTGVSEPVRPLSIDDIVELVKDKLDQPSVDSPAENQKETQIPTETVIVPIYHRTSSDQNDVDTKVESPNAHEIEAENSSEPKNIETNRAQSARSIKTAIKMDPRKRRFLFKSDAS